MIENKHTNRLIHESSPYLLQHASNPVQWYPWSQEAFAQAVKQNKPIFLSIGYAACHWCHVMEEESFEDEETAKLINDNFIAIKVDREERPDVDDVYMTAVQLMTGHGGWPLTVFLTPELKPFYGGTYFPRENRQHGQHLIPGFKTILKAVNQSWTSQRSEIEASSENITDTINNLGEKLAIDETDQKSSDGSQIVLEAGLRLLSQFDKKYGGFGRSPKFPQALCLFLCLRLAYKLKQASDKRYELFLQALRTSLDHMANGGIYDQLGGGFARYSTDEEWLVPHFEKMLYDNALLAQVYLEAFLLTGEKNWRKVGCETLDFMERELSSKDDAFYSSLDADSEGEEGKFYLWNKAEIAKILGADSEAFCQMFSVTEKGNFESGKNILHIDGPVGDNAHAMKEKLFAQRAKRVRPSLDNKMLVSWNGLAISAFVKGYQITGEQKYLEKAKQVARFILANLYSAGRLKHVYAANQAKVSGYLDDYAFFVQALIDLASVDSDPIWLNETLQLADSVMSHFYDQKQSDFFYTADDQEKLISRPKNNNDGPMPSATSVMVANLVKLAIITGLDKYKQYAQAVLNKYKPLLTRLPGQYANMTNAWDFASDKTLLFVLVTTGIEAKDKPMFVAVYSQYLPDKMVLIKPAGDELSKKIDSRLTIFSDKALLAGQTTVYMCNDYGCQPPINDVNSFKVAIKQILNEL